MTVFDDEEARAQAYRASAANRRANRRQQAAQLTPDSSARVSLGQRWAGMVQWLAERRQTPVPPTEEGDI